MKQLFKFLLYSALLFSAQILYGQPTFERLYGYLDNDWSYSILESSQGGFLVSGITSDYQNGNHDLYLLRLSDYGEIEWSVIYPTSEVWEDLTYGVERMDHSFAVVNKSESDSNYFSIHNFEQDGTGGWHRDYGLSDYYWSFSIVNLPDSGLLICGTVGWYQQKAFLFRTDSEGIKIWSKTYEGNYDEEYSAFHVTRTLDGGFVLVGNLNMYGSIGTYSGMAIRTDSAGNQIWKRFYENTDQGIERTFKDVIQLPNGQLLVLGYDFYGWWDYVYHPFLMCLTNNGDVSWMEYYEENIPLSKIFQNNTGQYILSGSRGDSVMFIRVDALGTQLHSVMIHSSFENPYLASSIPANDGSYLAAGSVMEFGGLGGSDVFVLKANAEGIITAFGEPMASLEVKIKKDPFTGKVLIESPEKINSFAVFDFLGHPWYPLILRSESNLIELDTGNLPDGIFLISCRTNQGVHTEKILKY